MPNKENIVNYKWKKGESGNYKGRPRKFVTTLKEIGYKTSEVTDTIQSMLSMNMNELKMVHDNPDATILEKTISKAMVKSYEKGSLYSIETLFNRVYGRPKEQSEIDLKSDNTINVIFKPYNGNSFTTTPQDADTGT